MQSHGLVFLSLLVLALSGCTAAAPSGVESSPDGRTSRRSQEPEFNGASSWDNQSRMLLVKGSFGMTAIGVCNLSPYPTLELKRDFGRILNGTGHVEVVAEADATFGGVQIGYSIDKGPTKWLPTAWAREIHGAQTFKVPVDPTQTEAGGDEEPRWTFYWRNNYPAALDFTGGCYTGAAHGGGTVRIEAVRGA